MEAISEKYAAFSAQVTGRVQGVGFRYSTIREAKRLGLHGWVRNTAEGDVEVWAEGPPEKLSLFGSWLHKGPPLARVDSVKIETVAPRAYPDFNAGY